MTGVDDLMTTARVVGALLVVLVVVALIARTVRRGQLRRSKVGMQVLERTGLSRDASVAVVEVAGKALVLGVTAHGVSVLTELDPEQLRAAEPGQAGGLLSVTKPVVASRPTSASTPGTAARSASVGPTVPRPRSGPSKTTAPDGAPRPDPTDPTDPTGPTDFDEIARSMLHKAVDLGEHPDLASALRAAGRVSEPEADPFPARNGQSAAPKRAQARASTGQTAASTGRTRAGGGRARSTDQRPGSGSVLDPATWRQGLEALRDLTARKS